MDLEQRVEAILCNSISVSKQDFTKKWTVKRRTERARVVCEAIDRIDAKYGKHTVFLGSSYAAINGIQHQGKWGERPRRRGMLLKGEGDRKRLRPGDTAVG